MISLEDLKKNRISYSWETIYVGVEENFFSIEEAKNYAMERIQKKEIEKEEFEICNKLLWGEYQSEFELLSSLKNYFFPTLTNGSSEWKKEYRKLRYCALMKISSENISEKELLNKIALLYDSIGYPEDMNSMINYMPQENGLCGEEYLLENFNDFLAKEKLFSEKI